jgi:hypothetical protein
VSWFARKRRVRVHFLPHGDGLSDFEGVLDGIVGDCYLLLVPKLLQDADTSYTLDNAVEIPCRNVWFMERLA